MIWHGRCSDDGHAIPGPEPVILSPEFSEDALALEFSARHKHELRYVQKWGSWLHVGRHPLAFRKHYRAFDLARAVAREFANTCNTKDGKKLRAQTTSPRSKGWPRRSPPRHDVDRLGHRPMATEHARRHCRSADRQAAAARPRAVHHQNYRRRARRRLPALAQVPR